MLAGMVINTFLMYGVNSYWSGKFIDYSVREQILDVLPGFSIAAIMAIMVYLIGGALPCGYLLRLIIQVAAGALVVFVLCERTRLDSYLYLKEIVLSKIILVKGRCK